ncbi:hypothetical protein PISS_a0348 [Pseudoalteromonas issachenkonii]|uniref:Integrase n=2 Tax=Pseudoalteromonas issachenkonii TaxID=152297 RepID=A0ABN5C3V5_9GAMM|nr:hypothetical protein [Pseudoalteromonas issachenkonii]ATC89405.1 hypothetical protein PISS_a0348 [Pseudoalteromonas issachenkonii]
MSNVIKIWEAKQQQDGKKNLEEFVRFAKDDLTIYQDQGWDVEKWKPNKGQTLVFGFQAGNYASIEPFDKPFMTFAKAFIRQQMTIKEISSAHLWIATLRKLYQVLQEQYVDLPPCILNVNNQTIKGVEQKIRDDNVVPMRKYHLGGKLQALVTWLLKNKILLTLPIYKSPFKKPANTSEQLGEEGDKFREERCPSMHEMLCLADCFARAKTVADKYYTSALVLLCFAPARFNELGGLTIHSLQQGDEGDWYVVWFGSKEYRDHRKGVPSLMLDTVKSAFKRLTDISEPARKAAKWAHDHPETFFRHKHCKTAPKHLEDAQLSHSEFAYAMNVVGSLHHTDKDKLNTPTKWINQLLEDNSLTYRRLNSLVHEKYKKKGWPNNPKSDRPIWENLLLIRDLELKPASATKDFSWVMPSVDTFNVQTTRKDKKMSNLWERFEMINENGKPLSLTTHQFRVWLNTHAKIGGVDDWKIAQWSGRADLTQNVAYDLRTLEQKDLLKTELMVASYEDSPSALVLRKARLPVPLKSIGVDREGVADFTGIGFCVHDFARTPCTKAGECVTCKEHVCIKGIPETLEELELLETNIAAQLDHALKEAADDTFGADRWVTHLGWKLAHIRTLIKTKTDDNVLDGTVIRIPVEHDPSPTRLALADKGLNTDLDGKQSEKKEDKLSSNISMRQLLGFS